MGNGIRIALVGADEIVRESISHMLGARGFSVRASVARLCDLPCVDDGGVDIVVMSIDPADDVPSLCESLGLPNSNVKFVLTATAIDVNAMVSAFRNKIHGIILNTSTCDQFAESLRFVAVGERFFPWALAEHLLRSCDAGSGTRLPNDRKGPPGPLAIAGSGRGLSLRETEVLDQLVDGGANKVIARQLDITEATVKVHLKSILRKLEVTNRTQAALWARSIGGNASPMKEAAKQLRLEE